MIGHLSVAHILSFLSIHLCVCESECVCADAKQSVRLCLTTHCVCPREATGRPDDMFFNMYMDSRRLQIGPQHVVYLWTLMDGRTQIIIIWHVGLVQDKFGVYLAQRRISTDEHIVWCVLVKVWDWRYIVIVVSQRWV